MVWPCLLLRRHLALARCFGEAEPEPATTLSILPLPLFSASLPASAMAEPGEMPLLLALLSLSSSPAVRSNVAPVTTAGHATPSSRFPGHRSHRSRPAAAAVRPRQRPWSGRGRLWSGAGHAWVWPGQPYPGWPPPSVDAPLLADPTPLPLPCVLGEVEEEGVNRK